ncbi:MAG: hypothetical protein KDA92_04600 [Planctomycetales bacterium]|nr:hypothetical protein [Planctomycetales bacterium]
MPSGAVVVDVEEDWELTVGEADPNVTAPQVTTAMSPNNGLDSYHAIFNLNHQALETFSPGGMQLQLWNGETPVAHNRLCPDDVLGTDGEVITWTQAMNLSNNFLYFRIVNGAGETWGDFGNDRLLTDRINVSMNNLNNYDPAVSLTNSGAVYAANRVESLVLKRVRLRTSDNQIYSFNLDFPVQQSTSGQ